MMKTRALAAIFLAFLVCFICVQLFRYKTSSFSNPSLDKGGSDGSSSDNGYKIGFLYKHITGAEVFKNVLRGTTTYATDVSAISGDRSSNNSIMNSDSNDNSNSLALSNPNPNPPDGSVQLEALKEKKQRLANELSVLSSKIDVLTSKNSNSPAVPLQQQQQQHLDTIPDSLSSGSNFIAILKGRQGNNHNKRNSHINSNSNSIDLKPTSEVNQQTASLNKPITDLPQRKIQYKYKFDGNKQHEANSIPPPPHLDSSKTTPSNLATAIVTCKYKIKVYVYDIPSDLLAVKLGNEARKNQTLHVCHKCILEQFSLEYILNDFFTQFCGRTYDPEEADFFYLPLVRDAEYRIAMSDHKNKKNRAPSMAEQALISLLDSDDSSLWVSTFKVPDTYWKRHKGADHIIVMPAPVTNLRHESSKRGFFHYMVHLHDPIFFGVEYSKSFVDEYPICSVKKNVVVPYPTTDVEFFNGKLLLGNTPRESLLYYAGGMHGDCIEVRTAMKQVMVNSTKLKMNIIPHIPSNQEQREHGFRAAVFCPIPVGDSPSSKRMYDVINFGCIPVVLSDDLIWAFSHQSHGPFDHSLFSLHIPQGVVQHSSTYLLDTYRNKPDTLGKTITGKLIYDLLEDGYKSDGEYINGVYVNPLVHILRRIPLEDITKYQMEGRRVAPFYRFYAMNTSMKSIPISTFSFPDGGAMEVVVDHLSKRKHEGIAKVADACREEKARKHKYVSRYPCDNSILRRRRRLALSTNGYGGSARRLEMIGFNPCTLLD